MARPAYERVGAAFRQAYEAAGLRQIDVAAALDVDPGTVSKWSRGLQRIDLEYFPSIDRMCGRPLGYVLTRAGYVDPAPPADVPAAIAADQDLDQEGRGALTMLYEVLKTRAVRGVGRTAAGTG
jgi:transcriptional regulator with XRE-family HTH domain